MSIQQILLLHRQTERDMAEHALLVLDAMNAATSRAWFKNGHKTFAEVTHRLLAMAGWKKHETATEADPKSNRKSLFARLGAMGAALK